MFYIYAGGESIYKPLDDQLVLFSPKLTLEIGKAGSLEFDIPPQNPFYDRMNQLSTEVSVDMDEDEIFHGRVLSNERAFNNVRHVYCEGDLSYLVDSVQKGVQYSGTTHDLFRKIISAHNARMDASKRFTVGTINIENRNVILVGHSEGENLNAGAIDYKQIAIDSIVDEWNNSFDYIQTCLIDYCGGYLRTRRVNGVIYIDLLQDFGNRAIQPIELGSNLLDLTEEITAEDVFTVLIPLGDDNLTIASVNGGSDELVDTNAIARFGRIVKTHVFNNVSSASTLLENARRFMATSINVPRTITVRAVDLHMLNSLISPIRIGDKVRINSAAHDVDDELTCTRIEYDLENPQNNNYTFGNPKQSLTQRYREDIRLNNDTYGNSASSVSSPSATSAKGASAAAAAAEKADKEKTKALQDFYDAWINVDPEQGHVDLGALYKKYIDGKEVLISQCGIDLDGKTGNVNIQSLHNVVDDHGHLIAENEAYIKMVETDTAVELQHVAERHDHLAGVEAEHYTAITQRADSLGSSIDLLARDVNEFEDHTTTAISNINLRADEHESSISSNTEFINKVDGKVNGLEETESRHYTSITEKSTELESSIRSVAGTVTDHGRSIAAIDQRSTENSASIKIVAETAGENQKNIASITVRTTQNESQIALKADTLVVDTKFNDLTTGITVAKALRAQDFKAGSISIWENGTESAVAVTTMNHSHSIAATEKDGGVVEFSIGKATTSVPQKTSFNIANTKYYKDGVAAVSIKSLERESYSTTGDYSVSLDNSYVRYDTAKKEIVGRIRITLGDNTIKPVVVKMAGNRAHDVGAQTAVVSSVTVGAVGTPSYSSEDKVYYATASITAKAQGTKADGTKYTSGDYTKNVPINVTNAYNAGKNAVGIKSVSKNSYSTTGDFSVTFDDSYVRRNNSGQIIGRAEIQLDGNSVKKNVVIYMAGDKAYNAGKDDGYNSGYNAGKKAVGIKSVTKNSYSTTGDFSVTFDDGYVRRNNSGQIVGRAEIQLDGSDVKKNVVIYMAGDKAYNAGYNAGNTDGYNSVKALASSNNIGYEQDESGSTDYSHIWVKLENSKMIGNIALPSSSGSISYENVNYDYPDYSEIPNYDWNDYTNRGTLQIKLKSTGAAERIINYDVTTLVQKAMSLGGGCKGIVEVRSVSGNSAFIKIYTSDWQAVPVGSSSVGKWIDINKSETFG